MSIIIGLTGGIGSGKSMVAKVFANLGIPVFDADAASKNIMHSNAIIKEKLIQIFGPEVYIHQNDQDNSNGEIINRAYLSKIVFSDTNKLALLNSIIHPLTIQASIDWASQQSAPYVIKEAALFFESGSTLGVHKIIGVSAPKALRMLRVMKRDSCTKEDVEKRMSNQIDERIKMKLCDWIIINDEQQLVLPQVIALHETIIADL